jgi:hypothetical protein
MKEQGSSDPKLDPNRQWESDLENRMAGTKRQETSKEYLEWKLVSPGHKTPWALVITNRDGIRWAVMHAEQPLEIRGAPETLGALHLDTERLNWMDAAQADVEYSQRAGELAAFPEVNPSGFPWARRKTIREAIDASRGSALKASEQHCDCGHNRLQHSARPPGECQVCPCKQWAPGASDDWRTQTSSEPEPAKEPPKPGARCQVTYRGKQCCKPDGHDGEHIATGASNNMRW